MKSVNRVSIKMLLPNIFRWISGIVSKGRKIEIIKGRNRKQELVVLPVCKSNHKKTLNFLHFVVCFCNATEHWTSLKLMKALHRKISKCKVDLFLTWEWDFVACYHSFIAFLKEITIRKGFTIKIISISKCNVAF